jgi:23S rRNA (pseudouridine1915-N3)-methyltransferase
MKRIKILSIGGVKEKYYQEAILEYKKRLSREVKLEIVELLAKSFSDSNMQEIKKQESQRILEYLDKNKDSKIFLLSENGEELDSVSFSKKIFSINEEIIFVIAGSLGFDFNILKGFSRLSLSKMTFLHEMAKLILVEQIYRALNIEKGKKYHY